MVPVSGDTSLTDVVVQEAQEQVDVGALVDGESVEEQIEPAKLGASVGAEIGESVGRTFGAAIGRRVYDALADVVDRDTDTDGVLTELERAVRAGVADAIDEMREDGSIVASIASIVQESDLDESLADLVPSDRTEEEVEAGEKQAQAEETGTETPEPTDEIDASDLEELRRDTLAEYLETISYRDLQDIAKEVDVKANLSREAMTDRIVDAVAGESAA